MPNPRWWAPFPDLVLEPREDDFDEELAEDYEEARRNAQRKGEN